MKQRLLSIFAMLSLMISGVMAQTFTISTDYEGYFIAGDHVEVSIDIEGAQEMTALQFNFSLPEGFTLSEGWPIYMGNATNGHAMNASILDSGDLFVVLYSLHSGTFDDGTLISFNVTAAEDAVSTQGKLYNVRTATTDAVSHTFSDVTFAMNIASEEPEPTWHLSGPATEEEITTQSYIDGLVYNQTTKPRTITLKKGYNVIIIPSSWTTPTFGLVSDFSKRYTPFTADDLGITNPSNKNVLVLWSEVENATCYVKWGTNVVPEPEPEPEPEAAYYWYLGNSEDIVKGDLAGGDVDWLKAQQIASFDELGYTSSGTKITMTNSGNNSVYILCPKSWSNKWQFWNVNNDINLTTGFQEVGAILEKTFTKNNVEYDLWWLDGYYGNIAHIRATAAAVEPEPEPEPEGLLTGKNYRVKNVTTGLYLQVEGNNTNMKLQNKAEGVALMQVFQLEEAAEGMYYIKAADSDNNYYAHASGWNFNATTNADNKTPFTIALVEGETQVYTLHQSVSANTGLAGTDDAAAGAAIYCDKGIDNNGKWTFEPLTEEENAIYVTTLTATAKAALDAAIARGEEVVATRSAVLTAEEVAAINGAVQAAKEGKDAATEVAALKALSDAIHAAVDAAIYVWSIDEVSNTLCYAVSTEDRGAWYAQATHLTSTTKAEVAVDVTDKQQLFAFVQSPETGALYLYSVSEEKFVKAEGGYTALTEDPEQTITILNGTRSAAFPWVVALNAEDGQKQMGISNGYDPAVITHWNDLGDGGNTVRIEKAATFDATAALAAIKALETGVDNSEFSILNSEVIYDLQGRRVEKATKGIYIVGGKKVVMGPL